MRGVLTLKSVYSVDVDDLGNHLWSGAKDRWDNATDEQRERAFSKMEDLFFDEEEIDDGIVNDFIWFDCDDIFCEEESEDEDDVTDEDEDSESDEESENKPAGHYELIVGGGEIKRGFGSDKGKWIVDTGCFMSKSYDIKEAAESAVLLDDYSAMKKFSSREEALKALEAHTNEVYEISPSKVYARVSLILFQYESGGFEVVETASKWNINVNE